MPVHASPDLAASLAAVVRRRVDYLDAVTDALHGDGSRARDYLRGVIAGLEALPAGDPRRVGAQQWIAEVRRASASPDRPVLTAGTPQSQPGVPLIQLGVKKVAGGRWAAGDRGRSWW